MFKRSDINFNHFGNVLYKKIYEFEVCFEFHLQQMRESKLHYITTIHHEPSDKVVASATLAVECKFIHTAANRGRIEDVVVHPDHQVCNVGYFAFLLLLFNSQVQCSVSF